MIIYLRRSETDEENGATEALFEVMKLIVKKWRISESFFVVLNNSHLS